jgi:hypothetical protein
MDQGLIASGFTGYFNPPGSCSSSGVTEATTVGFSITDMAGPLIVTAILLGVSFFLWALEYSVAYGHHRYGQHEQHRLRAVLQRAAHFLGYVPPEELDEMISHISHHASALSSSSSSRALKPGTAGKGSPLSSPHVTDGAAHTVGGRASSDATNRGTNHPRHDSNHVIKHNEHPSADGSGSERNNNAVLRTMPSSLGTGIAAH